MTTQEIQDHIHVYSMFSFNDGRKEPGICINKYNLVKGQVEYYFVPQENMHAYKIAFEKYEKETCSNLIFLLKPEEVMSIRSVSLNDYKIIMQLNIERNMLMNF